MHLAEKEAIPWLFTTQPKLVQDFINSQLCEPVVKSYILIMLGKCWSLIPVKLSEDLQAVDVWVTATACA